MVNTHRKFPVGAKHNAYYAADGTHLRDATKEEIENTVSLRCTNGRSQTPTLRGGKEEAPRQHRVEPRNRHVDMMILCARMIRRATVRQIEELREKKRR